MTQRDVTAAQACVLVNRREVARAFLSEARDDRGLAVALHASFCCQEECCFLLIP